MMFPYWRVQFSPEVREAEHVLDRIEEHAKENEHLLRDLNGIYARSRAIHLEITGLIDRLDRLRAGANSTPTMPQ
jgi:hypothetical protein